MSDKRIYEVKNTGLLDTHPSRLIEAENQAEVRRHLQKPLVISVPSPLRVLDLVQKGGVAVEKA